MIVRSLEQLGRTADILAELLATVSQLHDGSSTEGRAPQPAK
jgi:hypothetical protein